MMRMCVVCDCSCGLDCIFGTCEACESIAWTCSCAAQAAKHEWGWSAHCGGREGMPKIIVARYVGPHSKAKSKF